MKYQTNSLLWKIGKVSEEFVMLLFCPLTLLTFNLFVLVFTIWYIAFILIPEIIRVL